MDDAQLAEIANAPRESDVYLLLDEVKRLRELVKSLDAHDENATAEGARLRGIVAAVEAIERRIRRTASGPSLYREFMWADELLVALTGGTPRE